MCLFGICCTIVVLRRYPDIFQEIFLIINLHSAQQADEFSNIIFMKTVIFNFTFTLLHIDLKCRRRSRSHSVWTREWLYFLVFITATSTFIFCFKFTEKKKKKNYQTLSFIWYITLVEFNSKMWLIIITLKMYGRIIKVHYMIRLVMILLMNSFLVHLLVQKMKQSIYLLK